MKKGISKKILPIAAATTLAVTSLVGGSLKSEATAKPASGVKNVIMIIADGAGIPFYSAHRYMVDNPATADMEPTVFDPYFVGLQTTYANDPNQNVTDSASAATAMATGVKTYNNAIGLDVNKNPVKTVLEQAKEDGLATGLVATSQITHATPAAYAAHDESRKNEVAIADDYYDLLINGEHSVDVMLGGGTSFFERTDRNLSELFVKDGYTYVKTRDELLKDKNSTKLLGLFAPKGMNKAIDRTAEEPSLTEMSKIAIDRLSKDEDGFFLMIEASQIDWAGHDNDIVAAMSDMQEYADTFKYIMDWAKKDGETLVIATGDHSTGGLSIGAGKGYNFFVDPIKAFKRTPDFIAKEIAAGADVEVTMEKYIAADFFSKISPEEIQSVKDAVALLAENKYAVDNAIEKIVDNRVMSGWTTGGHTGEEVPVLAYGPQSDKVTGLIDNTLHAKVIFDILKQNKNGTKVSKDAAIKQGQIGKVISTSKSTLYKKTDNGLEKVKEFKKGQGYRVYKIDNKNKWYEVGGQFVVKFNDNVKYTEVK